MPTYYLSPTGNDSNAGDKANPWLTVAHAVSASSAGDTIVVTDGGYKILSAIVPKNGQTWVVDTGATPEFDAGKTVTSFSLYKTGSNMWVANYTGPNGDGTGQCHNLYIAKRRHTKHRLVTGTHGYTFTTWTTTGSPAHFVAGNSDLASSQNQSDIQLVFTGNRPWIEARIPVTSCSGTAVNVASPAITNWLSYATNYGFVSAPTAVENCGLFFFGFPVPGTFYWDRANGKIYVVPFLDEQFDGSQTVIVDALDGPIVASTGVSNVRFDGITFSGNLDSTPNTTEGWLDAQSGFRVDSTHVASSSVGSVFVRPRAAIEVSGGSNVTFPNCTVTRCGTSGIAYFNGTQSSTSTGVVFYDLSGCATIFGDMADITSSTPVSDVVFMDSIIKFIGQEFTSSAGTFSAYSVRCGHQYSLCRETPYTAFSTGIGWGQTLTTPTTTPNVAAANFVKNCVAKNSMKVLIDGGGIYLNNAQNGAIVSGNVINGSESGLYADNGSVGITFDGNFIQNCTHRFVVNDNRAPGSVFSNNFADTSTDSSDSSGSNTFTSNTGNSTVSTTGVPAIIANAGPRGSFYLRDTGTDPAVQLRPHGRVAAGSTARLVDATYPALPAKFSISLRLIPGFTDSDNSSNPIFFFKRTSGTGDLEFQITGNTCYVGYTGNGSSGQRMTFSPTGLVVKNALALWVFVFDNTAGSCIAYCNGQQVGTQATGMTGFSCPDGLTLFNYLAGTDSATLSTISDFCIYSEALSPAQVASLQYSSPLTIGSLIYRLPINGASPEVDTVGGRTATVSGSFNDVVNTIPTIDQPLATAAVGATTLGGLRSVLWLPVANATGYKLYANDALIYTGSANYFQYAATPDGATITYRVVATNAEGTSNSFTLGQDTANATPVSSSSSSNANLLGRRLPRL